MKGNLLQDLPRNLPEEEFLPLLRSGNVRIERIVSTGHSSPDGFWYDQDENEWVIVLEGWGIIEYEDGSSFKMNKGDWVHLPAGVRHRIVATRPAGPTVWLAIFYR